MNIARVVRELTDPMRRRVMLMVGRAVVRAIDDSRGRQQMQIELLAGELRGAVERMQQYGFTSHPHPGADAAAVFVAGNREQGIIVAVDDRRYRLTGLAVGEVALYDDLGNVVALRRDKVEVAAVQHLEATAPTAAIQADVTITGSLTVNGSTTLNGAVTNNGKNIGDTHTHSGVTPGSGTSGGVT